MRLAALKKKIDRLTVADGGALTPEHVADLQQGLDELNRTYRPPERRRRRSTV
jgi:hypothetical protein